MVWIPFINLFQIIKENFSCPHLLTLCHWGVEDGTSATYKSYQWDSIFWFISFRYSRIWLELGVSGYSLSAFSTWSDSFLTEAFKMIVSVSGLGTNRACSWKSLKYSSSLFVAAYWVILLFDRSPLLLKNPFLTSFRKFPSNRLSNAPVLVFGSDTAVS